VLDGLPSFHGDCGTTFDQPHLPLSERSREISAVRGADEVLPLRELGDFVAAVWIGDGLTRFALTIPGDDTRSAKWCASFRRDDDAADVSHRATSFSFLPDFYRHD
jgi:hypothetical protein